MDFTLSHENEREDLMTYIENKFIKLYQYRPNILYTRTGFILTAILNGTSINIIYRRNFDHYQVEYSKLYDMDGDVSGVEYNYEFNQFNDVIEFFDYIIDTILPPPIYL
jgi:hypothetical protein